MHCVDIWCSETLTARVAQKYVVCCEAQNIVLAMEVVIRRSTVRLPRPVFSDKLITYLPHTPAVRVADVGFVRVSARNLVHPLIVEVNFILGASQNILAAYSSHIILY